MATHRVTITGADRQAMLDLVTKHHIRVFDHGIHYQPDRGWTVGAFAAADQVKALEKSGYTVKVYEDVAKHTAARRKEVGKGPYVRRSRRH